MATQIVNVCKPVENIDLRKKLDSKFIKKFDSIIEKNKKDIKYVIREWIGLPKDD